MPGGGVIVMPVRVNASNGDVPSAVCGPVCPGAPGSTRRSWSTFAFEALVPVIRATVVGYASSGVPRGGTEIGPSSQSLLTATFSGWSMMRTSSPPTSV